MTNPKKIKQNSQSIECRMMKLKKNIVKKDLKKKQIAIKRTRIKFNIKINEN
jgi:hypothetical protein